MLVTSLFATHLWAVVTVIAAVAQTFRNALQRGLTGALGTAGATYVRFLFGLPFGVAFLALALAVTGLPLPPISAQALGWTAFGGLAQIAATGLMLAAMRTRSFVVTTAYIKTEPVLVAIFGLVILGERPSLITALAILVATAGVLLVSWPKSWPKSRPNPGAATDWRPALLGVMAAACFALSAVGFRGGVRALDTPSVLVAASTVLALGLAIQSGLLIVWLAAFDRAGLAAILRSWRPSLGAGFLGAFASQFWFLGFALASVAQVRTLALVEVIFAQVVSRNIFRQGASAQEYAGIGLIVAGVVMLVNG